MAAVRLLGISAVLRDRGTSNCTAPVLFAQLHVYKLSHIHNANVRFT